MNTATLTTSKTNSILNLIVKSIKNHAVFNKVLELLPSGNLGTYQKTKQPSSSARSKATDNYNDMYAHFITTHEQLERTKRISCNYELQTSSELDEQEYDWEHLNQQSDQFTEHGKNSVNDDKADEQKPEPKAI